MGGVIRVNNWKQDLSSIGNTYGGLVQIAQHIEGILLVDVSLHGDAKGTVMYGDVPIVEQGKLKCSKHPHLNIRV